MAWRDKSVISESEDLRLKQAITVEEIRACAAEIQVGDPIKWRVLTGAADTQNHYPTTEKQLTVIRKSRNFLVAVDRAGLRHSIRYIELVQKKRKEKARLMEMRNSARRVKK